MVSNSKGYPLQRGSTETQPARPRRKAKKGAEPGLTL